MIQIKIEKDSLREAARIMRAIPRGFPRVMRRAINRTVDMAATDLKRRAGEQITLKKSEIAKGISKKKASMSNLSGTIGTTAYRPGVAKFPGTRQTKRGVTYRISKIAGRKRIESGFIAVMPSGHRGAFTRKSLSRLPIAEAKGPSIWKVVTNTPGLLKAAIDSAVKNFTKQINDYIGLELRRWSKR